MYCRWEVHATSEFGERSSQKRVRVPEGKAKARGREGEGERSRSRENRERARGVVTGVTKLGARHADGERGEIVIPWVR